MLRHFSVYAAFFSPRSAPDDADVSCRATIVPTLYKPGSVGHFQQFEHESSKVNASQRRSARALPELRTFGFFRLSCCIYRSEIKNSPVIGFRVFKHQVVCYSPFCLRTGFGEKYVSGLRKVGVQELSLFGLVFANLHYQRLLCSVSLDLRCRNGCGTFTTKSHFEY